MSSSTLSLSSLSLSLECTILLKKSEKNSSLEVNNVKMQSSFEEKLDENYDGNYNNIDDIKVTIDESISSTKLLKLMLCILEIGIVMEYLSKNEIFCMLSTSQLFITSKCISPNVVRSIKNDIMLTKKCCPICFEYIIDPKPLCSIQDLWDLDYVYNRLNCCYKLEKFYELQDQIVIKENSIFGIFSSLNGSIEISFEIILCRGIDNSTDICLTSEANICDTCLTARCNTCCPIKFCDECFLSNCIVCMKTQYCTSCNSWICINCNDGIPFNICLECHRSECIHCSENLSFVRQCHECSAEYCISCHVLLECGNCGLELCDSCGTTTSNKIKHCECFCGCDESRCGNCMGIKECANQNCSKLRCDNCDVYAECSNTMCNVSVCSDCSNLYSFESCFSCKIEYCKNCYLVCSVCENFVCNNCTLPSDLIIEGKEKQVCVCIECVVEASMSFNDKRTPL